MDLPRRAAGKIRDEGSVSNRAVYLALGIAADGTKECGGHLDRAERGSQVLVASHERFPRPRRWSILIAVVDSLMGFPEAITSVFPFQRQTCVVHLSRFCLSWFAVGRERQALARQLKAIYRAETAEAAAKSTQQFNADP